MTVSQGPILYLYCTFKFVCWVRIILKIKHLVKFSALGLRMFIKYLWVSDLRSQKEVVVQVRCEQRLG